MALINPPAWMQAGSYPARTDRLALTALISYPGFGVDEATPMRIRQGVKPSYQNYQLKVRPSPTPNMTVIVSAGFAYVDQHDAGGQGTYICVNDSDVVLTVQPAGGAGQFRKDTVVASVYDGEYVGSSSEWRLEIIQGPYATSAGTTQRGTLPNNAQVLADINIGPNQTSISAGNISDLRNYSVAAGGIVPVSSSIAPNRLHPGQVLYLTDTDVLEVGTQAGPKRQLREYLRPSVSLQQSAPPFNQTGTYVDFTSAAWAPITVTVPPSGMVRVSVAANLENTNTSTSTCHATWRASGAISVGASSYNSVTAVGGRVAAGRTRLITGATPGQSLTITPQWNISSGSSTTATVSGGTLEVTPIP
ncbi:hypothetical protein DIZ27_23065 [Streptomyces sp. NWU339]|uniref:hypothetical protein n=1 Tax=Streptomyces sp. NWU339 TaxID=2185284 RepID=UPI000D6796A6|nr:hypothetical protein [Streptomyces sp. NWU339]PWI08322.1 hypothetical protein DIZ27_23065 [Streptomyces sp. NWU339]